ncbi:MAG TPA: hypothetical protein VIM11_20850 [Tepidisphaeraceae bacterium]
MDEFVGFEFVSLDASEKDAKVKVLAKEPRRERVDLISRQFHDFLMQGDPADTEPHGMVLTSDFKVRRKVEPTAGWVTFMVDRGDGKTEQLEEVALVVFARADDREGREALKRLEPYIKLTQLPQAPVVVAVKLARAVPLIVSDWYGKSVAAFFSQQASA